MANESDGRTETDWGGVGKVLLIVAGIGLGLAMLPLLGFLFSLLWFPLLVIGIIWMAISSNKKPVPAAAGESAVGTQGGSAEPLPFLFLDVDGVLNCPGGPDVRHVEVDGMPIAKPRAVDRRIDRLERYFRIVWATSWGEGARAIYPDKKWDVLDWGGPGEEGKLPAILRHAGTTPWAWVDDLAGEELNSPLGDEITDRPRTPWFAYPTDPQQGLTDAALLDLIRWARGLGA